MIGLFEYKSFGNEFIRRLVTLFSSSLAFIFYIQYTLIGQPTFDLFELPFPPPPPFPPKT